MDHIHCGIFAIELITKIIKPIKTEGKLIKNKPNHSFISLILNTTVIINITGKACGYKNTLRAYYA